MILMLLQGVETPGDMLVSSSAAKIPFELTHVHSLKLEQADPVAILNPVSYTHLDVYKRQVVS